LDRIDIAIPLPFFEDFLIEPGWTFLNHGAFGAALRVGHERAAAWRDHVSRVYDL
jgi:hypothetical protein